MEESLTTLAGSVIIAVALATVVRARGWSIALPLILGGVIVGILPWGPQAPPEPEIVLIAILAPLVFGEALGSSFVDLRRVSRPVIALAVGLVVVGAVIVGGIAASVAGIPAAMALALGAVLAPTDAVAVSAVARRAGLPRRVVSVLEGESLVNDASGLTLLKVALLAAATGAVTQAQVVGTLALAVVSGVGVGLVGGWILTLVLRRNPDQVAANALVLVAPFVLYPLAEHLRGSGILAVVTAGLLVAHRQNSDPGAKGRLQAVTVWRQITFILQAFAFFLVGLELIDTIDGVAASRAWDLVGLVAAVTATLVVVRMAFVLLTGAAASWRASPTGRRMYLKGSVVIGWAGARGPVSGLAAFSIPVVFASGEAVPDRDLILATTFCVVVITLLFSLLLAPLARVLRLEPDDDSATLSRVEAQLARAALERLTDIEAEADEEGDPLSSELVDRLRAGFERRISRTERVDGPAPSRTREAAALRAMIRAEQEELIRLRDDEGIPDSLVRTLMADLDRRLQMIP